MYPLPCCHISPGLFPSSFIFVVSALSLSLGDEYIIFLAGLWIKVWFAETSATALWNSWSRTSRTKTRWKYHGMTLHDVWHHMPFYFFLFLFFCWCGAIARCIWSDGNAKGKPIFVWLDGALPVSLERLPARLPSAPLRVNIFPLVHFLNITSISRVSGVLN